jgi:hypothetical protein
VPGKLAVKGLRGAKRRDATTGSALDWGFRGGRIARRGEDGPAARAGAVSRGASPRGPADGAGERRCGETPASPALRGGTLDCPARPFGDSALMPGARPGVGLRGAPKVCPWSPRGKAASPGRAQRRATLRHMAHRAPGARRRGPSRGTCEEHGCPTPTDRGHRQPKTRGTAEGLPAWLSSRQAERGALPPAPTAVLNLGPGCWMLASQPGLAGNDRTGGGNSGRFSV